MILPPTPPFLLSYPATHTHTKLVNEEMTKNFNIKAIL